MAVLDAELRADSARFADSLGATRDRIPSGVSVGIHRLARRAARRGRRLHRRRATSASSSRSSPAGTSSRCAPSATSSAPTCRCRSTPTPRTRRDDTAPPRRLDEFDLLLIEQPLPEDDLLGHAELAPAAQRRRCASTSRSSRRTAARRRDRARRRRDRQHQARAGRRLPRRRAASTTCAVARGIPVWCGGMLETGIGRAANAALASLAGLHAARRHLGASTGSGPRDIVTDPIDGRRRPRHRPDVTGVWVRARPRVPRLDHDVDGRARPLSRSALAAGVRVAADLDREWTATAGSRGSRSRTRHP